MKAIRIIGLLMTLTLFCGAAFAAEFPLRGKYPDVTPISIEDLAANYDSTIIVDVRSKMEFDVAHIAKATHVSISDKSFIKDLEAVRGKSDATIAL